MLFCFLNLTDFFLTLPFLRDPLLTDQSYTSFKDKANESDMAVDKTVW